MTIKPGDSIPSSTLHEMTEDGIEEVATDDFFKGRKIVMFGLPGAFTPTCHRNHLPGFLDNLGAIQSKGVDEVAVLAVNDPFVMGAWSKDTGGKGKIRFLSDGDASFSKALGLEIDLGAKLGLRCKRFSMIIEDGVVKTLNIEEAPGKVESSGAAAILEQL